MEKYIVKQNKKGNEFTIFDLNCKANNGMINCIELLSGNYTSWGEASLAYYYSLIPCKNNDILECIKRDFKRLYDVNEIKFVRKITKKDRKIIWGV